MYATVQQIIKKYAGKSYNWKKGDIVNHPRHGRVVIISGQYLDQGRVSNFWYWRKVNKDNKPHGKKYHGYGWE